MQYYKHEVPVGTDEQGNPWTITWVNDRPKPDAPVPSYAKETEITKETALLLAIDKLDDEISNPTTGADILQRVTITTTEARLLLEALRPNQEWPEHDVDPEDYRHARDEQDPDGGGE